MNLKLDEKIVATSGSSAWEFFRGPKGPANDDVDSTRLRPKGRSLLVHNEIVLGNERVANISDVNWLVSPSVGNPDAIVFPALRQPDSELAVPRAVVPDFRLVPEPVKSGDRFRLLQKFEAVVVERLEDSFIARFSDPSRDGIEEEAEIAFGEISESDLPLVQPGAVFYWSIGYERKSFGQVSRVSLIRFRRLPPLTDEEIEGARIRASMLHAILKRTSDPDPAIV
jgi:hypothetical protein